MGVAVKVNKLKCSSDEKWNCDSRRIFIGKDFFWNLRVCKTIRTIRQHLKISLKQISRGFTLSRSSPNQRVFWSLSASKCPRANNRRWKGVPLIKMWRHYHRNETCSTVRISPAKPSFSLDPQSSLSTSFFPHRIKWKTSKRRMGFHYKLFPSTCRGTSKKARD